jgi:SHAQKYF class myb-like DNA-binding protein
MNKCHTDFQIINILLIYSMKNELSSSSLSQASTDTRRLRQKSRIDYSGVPDTYQYNVAIGLNNGRWSLDEHKNFITGVFMHGNNWKEITNVIGTRNCPQARSHGQKFFTKLAKMNLEGITEDMCNVKRLHCIYNNSTHEDIKKLYYTLTDVAYKFMENDNESKKKEEEEEEEIEESNIVINKSERKESFLSDLDTNKLEYSYAHLKEINIDDDIPDPDIDINDFDEQTQFKQIKVDHYYKWMFEKVSGSITEDFVEVNKVATEDVDMVSDEINSYYDELTFNYFNSFK